jgi:hypothetical protein
MMRTGWRQVMRAAGSKGSADLFMVHPEYGGALVQVGTESKSLGPGGRQRFLRDAADTGSLAIIAIATRRGITYHQCGIGSAGTWDEWSP